MLIKHINAPKKIKGAMKINSYKINSQFSGSLIEINGDHGPIKCIAEDRIYFIITGSGNFIVDSEKSAVEANDLIFIPKNTPYNIIGKMKYLLICSPEFNPEHDIFLNPQSSRG